MQLQAISYFNRQARPARERATTSLSSSSLRHAHFTRSFSCSLFFSTDAKSSWSGIKIQAGWSFPLCLQAKSTRKKRQFQRKDGYVARLCAKIEFSKLLLSVFCFRESSEHFQKSASKQIRCCPMALVFFTWIWDYPGQVQIAEWQALEEHWVRFTSWCVTEQEGG